MYYYADSWDRNHNYHESDDAMDGRINMSEVIEEYGGMILAAAGTLALFGVLGKCMFAQDGLLAQMILAWGNGGC